MKREPNERGRKGTNRSDEKPNLIKTPAVNAWFACKARCARGRRGRERRKEREKEMKRKDCVPSYDASVQGHTKTR